MLLVINSHDLCLTFNFVLFSYAELKVLEKLFDITVYPLINVEKSMENKVREQLTALLQRGFPATEVHSDCVCVS